MAVRKKPPALLMVAIINLVLGLPCMCCMGVGALGTAAGMGPGGKAQPAPAPGQAANPFTKFAQDAQEQQEFMAKKAPGYQTGQLAFMIVSAVFSLVLIVTAVGLLLGQSWGRLLCIIACALVIPLGVAHLVHRVVYVLPAAREFTNQKMQKAGGAAPPAGSVELGGAVGLLPDAAIGVFYPLLAIALLMTGPVREYFASGGPRQRVGDSRFDEFQDEFRRRGDDEDRRRDDDDR
jgi:predicted membrane protein DUF2127